MLSRRIFLSYRLRSGVGEVGVKEKERGMMGIRSCRIVRLDIYRFHKKVEWMGIGKADIFFKSLHDIDCQRRTVAGLAIYMLASFYLFFSCWLEMGSRLCSSLRRFRSCK